MSSLKTPEEQSKEQSHSCDLNPALCSIGPNPGTVQGRVGVCGHYPSSVSPVGHRLNFPNGAVP